ncbi:hypothetical protein [Lentilactobacillus laojiaonis]|uniref:hypothetical protein n=1 Tax=Lentilactobacillus laojiaonis TaxID=2883998 RepID=UPI001D09A59D|nr:hypothetical protein [Lentilactobacillus laojiaonis]UDM32115.1 hypothetical protein LHL71_06195 [Lentilactobacillus laojiaonis]
MNKEIRFSLIGLITLILGTIFEVQISALGYTNLGYELLIFLITGTIVFSSFKLLKII